MDDQRRAYVYRAANGLADDRARAVEAPGETDRHVRIGERVVLSVIEIVMRSQLSGGMIWGISGALHEMTEIDRRHARYTNDDLANT